MLMRIMHAMSAVAHIRNHVFKLNQAAFAKIAGVTQATVSRWENGEFPPNRDNMERIRQAALADGKPWDDSWFFEVPSEVAS